MSAPGFVAFDDVTLRVADVSYWKWDRGHSYSALEITMRDGHVFRIKDWQGSAYRAEEALIAALSDTSAPPETRA